MTSQLLKFIERLSEAIKIFALIWTLALGSVRSQILSILNILSILVPFIVTIHSYSYCYGTVHKIS